LGIANDTHVNANHVGPDGVFQDSRIMSGVAAGAGVEVAITGNVNIKAAYLYLDLPDKNLFATPNAPSSPADERMHTVKVGVNWLFH
jgi:opacity protein-like surface antigen